MIPRHVAACHHSPERNERWYVYAWNRANSATQVRIPYCCQSWRCPVCRRYEASVTFARIKQACEPLDPSGFVFLVLTLDQEGYQSGKPWENAKAAYKKLGALTRAALSRIGRNFGPESRLECSGRKRKPRVVRFLGNRWVSTVEAHRSGWPHVNVLLWCPELAAHLRQERAERLADPEVADAVALAQELWRQKEPIPAHVRELARKASVIGGPLRELLTDAGWGFQSTAEVPRDLEAVFGYLVKVAGLHEASVGELSKVTQLPLCADNRFRRLRAGRGFLPPRITNPNITGCLVRRRRAGYSHYARWRGASEDWEIDAVNPPKDPEQLPAVARARGAEFQLIREEEALLAKNRGKLPPMPPLRVVRLGELEPHRVTTAERWAALMQEAMAAAG